ncbi:MAG: 4-hydroxybenzoate octaprenyltransferase [Methylotetracoccus sp.]
MSAVSNPRDPGALSARLRLYWRLARFDKPIGIFLLLWPALWALWVAGEGSPKPGVVAIIVLGVVLMRAAGCVINDYADRDFDPHVERTRLRPIAAGLVAPAEALALFVVLCLVAFVLVLFTNPLTIALSVPGALLAASYPFMKRYTHLPQAYLGVAFGWAVPMSFAAQTGAIAPVAWPLFGATVLWALIYDTMYAMVDRDDDLRIGVKSTAILFGAWDRIVIAVLQFAMLAVLSGIGASLELGSGFYVGLSVAAGLAAYQQYLIRNRDRGACFDAFLNNHWFGAAVFAGLVIGYVTR